MKLNNPTIRLTAINIFEKDAVGNFCLDLAETLRGAGWNVELYARGFVPDSASHIKHMDQFRKEVQKSDIIITSYSIFDPDLDFILSLPNRKLCYFHGVTPPEFLEKFEPVTADQCRRSQAQFPKLARFDILMANSRFTASHLAQFVGDKPIEALPPVFASRPLLADLGGLEGVQRDPSAVLMVGRVVPHKNIETAIEIFAAVHRKKSGATLTVIGESVNPDYFAHLQQKILESKIDSNSIKFTGKVSDAELRNYYRASGIYLSTSLHEGFCIPVLEAMRFALPVFVLQGNAAAEVAGHGEFLFDKGDYPFIADKIVDIMSNSQKREESEKYGLRRAAELLHQNSPEVWIRLMDRLI